MAGSKGLAIILRSDTPAGKGRVSQQSKRKIAKPMEGQTEPAEDKAAGSAAAVSGGSAVGSAVASPGAALPAAPSDFCHYADQARTRSHMMCDYTALLKMGMAVEGRFCQPCAFRYQDDSHIQAIGIQPEVATAWQSLTLLQRWELSGISPPSSWLDMSKEGLQMARRGTLPWASKKFMLSNKNCRFMRGKGLFRHLYKDLQSASRALSMETRKAHPILLVDPTCWGGESMEELLQIAVDANQLGQRESAGGSVGGPWHLLHLLGQRPCRSDCFTCACEGHSGHGGVLL